MLSILRTHGATFDIETGDVENSGENIRKNVLKKTDRNHDRHDRSYDPVRIFKVARARTEQKKCNRYEKIPDRLDID